MLPTKSFNPVKLFFRNKTKDYSFIEGSLVLSTWTIHFYSKDGRLDLEETYNSISVINKVKRGNLSFIEFEFKDMKLWLISVLDSMTSEVGNAVASYATLRDPIQKEIALNCQAFEYILPFDYTDDGWKVFNQREDIERMFQPLDPSKLKWTISEANIDYKICPSYPSLLVLPNGFDVTLLQEAASYREGGRLPALSWIHPSNYATITRCSQPLPGRLGNKRCEADEALIKAIFEANPSVPLSSNKILDARPFSNAMANRAKGAGYEKTDLYGNVTIEFLDIENIHQMRESLEKFKRLCYSATLFDPNWLSKLEGTSWLQHVQSVLKGAIRMATYVHKGISVVLHCSHGWDRTAQLSSLAQLLLDPHYRTIRGFQQLIEKEWISFGHRVQDRAAHLTYLDPTSSPSLKEEESPIFLQFLDCVHQLLQQFPAEFGFSDDFLRTVCEHFYSCRFGTFLANSEQEQRSLQLHSKTVSLWTYTNHSNIIKKFENPFFAFARHFKVSPPNTFLYASGSMDQIVFWAELYNGPERIVGARRNEQLLKGIGEMMQEAERLRQENMMLKQMLNMNSSNNGASSNSCDKNENVEKPAHQQQQKQQPQSEVNTQNHFGSSSSSTTTTSTTTSTSTTSSSNRILKDERSLLEEDQANDSFEKVENLTDIQNQDFV